MSPNIAMNRIITPLIRWPNSLYHYIAKRIEATNKALKNGRNERRLHFSIQINNQETPLEINASGIFQFERSKLLALDKLDAEIDKNTTLTLKNWLAERFRRDVWPDAFNSSIDDKAKKRLKKYYARRNEFISGIYLKLDSWEEKAQGKKYTLSAIIAIEDGKLRSFRKSLKDKERSLVNADNNLLDTFLRNELKVALGQSVDWQEDLTLPPMNIAIEIKTENQITMSHQKYFRRLNPYTMSEESESAPMPAEMIGD